MKLGIDFGTTNSAVAVVDPDGRARALELLPGERTQRTVIHGSPEGVVTFGNAAFRAYQDHDLEGRFLRSIKAFLPHDVPKTTLCGKRLSFTDVVSAYLVFLRERVETLVDQPITAVTVGRPVAFHADPAKHQVAVERLEQAVRDAGFDEVRLQLEPVAAAHAFEATLDRERIVLVGDFGGGTSDFAILRVGPERRGGDRSRDVLATSGVAKAGDVLDGRFLDRFVVDDLGRRCLVTPRYGGEPTPWDHSVLRKVQRLFDLHLLRTDELDLALDYVETHTDDPTPIRRLRRLVFDDLGYPMAWAIEATKRRFADEDPATFVFDDFHSPTLNLHRPIPLPAFATACDEVLQEYHHAIDLVLDRAGLDGEGIDDVFLTGGTAQLPFVEGLFRTRFGADKLRSADAFTSVCEGLALS